MTSEVQLSYQHASTVVQYNVFYDPINEKGMKSIESDIHTLVGILHNASLAGASFKLDIEVGGTLYVCIYGHPENNGEKVFIVRYAVEKSDNRRGIFGKAKPDIHTFAITEIKQVPAAAANTDLTQEIASDGELVPEKSVSGARDGVRIARAKAAAVWNTISKISLGQVMMPVLSSAGNIIALSASVAANMAFA